MKNALLLVLVFFALAAQAKVEVLFHPRHPTLEHIAEWIHQAESRIDIAMYNMDTTDASPVVQALKSAALQQRLRSGDLKIRLIFEGYGKPAENEKKMSEIEALGIDVRYLGKGVKIHHKFAVIDTGTAVERVVTGSANWSLSSYRNYNENILFFDGEPEPSRRYQGEFNRLWKNCREFGKTLAEPTPARRHAVNQSDLDIHFNSPRHLGGGQDGIYLTAQVVRLLDEAKHEVDIATTRIRLEPILDAVVRAAERGVRVRIVISQDDYRDLYRRAKWLFASPNIQLRVKFYNLKVANYMTYQMHNKFMIVDRSVILTGSFNWSKSSEENHIENLAEIRDEMAGKLLPDFQQEFILIWDLNRDGLGRLQDRWAGARAAGVLPPCAFAPTALEMSEIKQMLRLNKNCAP